MTRFKEALNELRGKYAAKRAKAYMKQHRGTRPVRGTPAQEDAAEKATRDPQRPGKRGGYNDSVVAASQGLIKTRGGEKVSADHVAKTFRRAGKHAVGKARQQTGKLTYGRNRNGSMMSRGQGGRGGTPQQPSQQRSSTTILGDALVEALKERCWKGYEPTPGKRAYSKGSCKLKGRKRKNESESIRPNKGLPARPSKGSTTGVARGGKPITAEQRAQALKDDEAGRARRLAKAQEIADRRRK